MTLSHHPSPDSRHGVRLVSCVALFSTFLKIGVLGFGGVSGWVRLVLVEERRYLDDREFAELQGVANILPGANTVNLAVLLGNCHQGVFGALSALTGLLLVPLLIIVALGALTENFVALPDVANALAGAGAATAGLVIANACKMARGVRPNRPAVVVALLTFLALGILHLPLVATMALAVPASLIALTLRRHKL